ncbi:NUDIX hydrolase [Streptomyces sp. PTD9-10]|uniref:NUDIX hydrolase n=1 Tax=Streptomyces sp. PTD9-10 TaxID=3120151 RepID=UPI00300B350B
MFVRDEHDRPVQLRSVYGAPLWQFPGGNLNMQGEAPPQTACREAIEKTSLEIGPQEPKLLLTPFLHAGTRLSSRPAVGARLEGCAKDGQG